MPFPRSRTLVVLTAALVVQGGLYYATAFRSETAPAVAPLETFPAAFGEWRMAQDAKLEPEVLDVLRPSDYLNRVYVDPSRNQTAVFFIAYFQTQRTGAAPHSPKNCLPGAGWEPLEAPGRVSIDVAGLPAPISANLYVVARGDQKSMVIYWYQSHRRVIAGEFAAKMWLIADSIRYRRSDTALVKVVIPMPGDRDQALDAAVSFVKAVFPSLLDRLPS